MSYVTSFQNPFFLKIKTFTKGNNTHKQQQMLFDLRKTFWVLVKDPRTLEPRDLLSVPGWQKRGAFPIGVVGEQRILRVPRSIHVKYLFYRFRKRVDDCSRYQTLNFSFLPKFRFLSVTDTIRFPGWSITPSFLYRVFIYNIEFCLVPNITEILFG